MTQQDTIFLPFSAFILAKSYDIHFKVAVGFAGEKHFKYEEATL